MAGSEKKPFKCGRAMGRTVQLLNRNDAYCPVENRTVDNQSHNFENFVLVTIKAGVALGIGNVFAFCIKLWL